jgi:site-specific recombinase XerD
MDDYEKFEIECEKVRQDNEKYLNKFSEWLNKSKLSEKIINKHISNIEFYINDYLLYDDINEAKDGSDAIGMFLGYWFIRKAMCSSKATIKSNATSLKKFYAFMKEENLITGMELSRLNETIKEDMPKWLATMDRYDNITIDDIDDVWDD